MRRPANRRPSTTGKRVSAALVVAGTVIGVLAGATALFDWFGAKVDPADAPPPAHIDSRVLGVSLRGKGQRLGAYLDETRQSKVGLTTFELAEDGYVFLARLRAKGNQGE